MKRNIISKIILLSSISSCALLFSCGEKSLTSTKDINGEIIEFEDISEETIDYNLPTERIYTGMYQYESLDRVLKYAYTTPKTDFRNKNSHNVIIKYGIGDELYNHIKKYENEAELYDKTQQIKLSIYRMSYSCIDYFEGLEEVREYPYYDRELTKKDSSYIRNSSGTKLSDFYRKEVIYTEINTLGYYFSEEFKYDKLEYTDTVTKDDLEPVVAGRSNDAYGILQYFFLLEPLNESDEIIKYGRKANEAGSRKAATKSGMETITWEKDDYVFPIADIEHSVFGKRQINHSALRMLNSRLNITMTYRINDNNVLFYYSKELPYNENEIIQ